MPLELDFLRSSLPYAFFRSFLLLLLLLPCNQTENGEKAYLPLN
jgi:hypothetical protein